MKFDIEDETVEKKKIDTKKIKIYAAVFFLILAILLIIIYLTTKNNNMTKNTTPKSNEEIPKKTEIEVVDETSKERVFAVIIDNDLNNIKHAGLQDSYIIYEAPVENNKTKLIALYKDSEVGVIGPVTSADYYFLDYLLEHNAVLVSYGMSEYTQKLINTDNEEYIGKEDSKAFMQDINLESPHNIFTSTPRMIDMLNTKNYDTKSSSWKVLKYSLDDISLKKKKDSEKADYVEVSYSNSENRQYKYNDKNKSYLRSNNNEKDLDRKTSEQLHFKNIIIIYVEKDIVPRENIMGLITTGEGKGYYITNGNAISIKWNKQSRTSKTRFTYNDGKELKINDGNTLIEVVPTDGEINIK